MIHTKVYRDGVLAADEMSVENLLAALDGDGTVCWLHVDDPRELGDTALQRLAQRLHSEPDELARLSESRVPFASYDDTRDACIAALPVLVSSGNQVRVAGFGLALSPRLLVTTGPEISRQLHGLTGSGHEQQGRDGVLSLLRHVLESYLMGCVAVVRQVDARLSDVEETMFAEGSRAIVEARTTHALGRLMAPVRRVLHPLPDVMDSLDDAAAAWGQPGYLAVVDRRASRLQSEVDVLHDSLNALLQAQMAAQGNRLNDDMRRLTAYAAMGGALAVISSYYGMNVRIFPAAGTLLGGIVALVLMVLVVSGLYGFFVRIHWLPGLRRRG